MHYVLGVDNYRKRDESEVTSVSFSGSRMEIMIQMNSKR